MPDEPDLDELESTLTALCTRVRWEVRGPAVVLVGELPAGRIEVRAGAGQRCDVRLVGITPDKLPWIAAALIGAERTASSDRPHPVRAASR